MYDDFFRQDHDFGSDADSDGEQASAAAIQRRDGMENLGPRFLTAHHSHSQRAIKLDAEFEAVACSEREKDVVRLRAYCAVVHAAPALLPYLGGGTSSDIIVSSFIFYSLILHLSLQDSKESFLLSFLLFFLSSLLLISPYPLLSSPPSSSPHILLPHFFLSPHYSALLSLRHIRSCILRGQEIQNESFRIRCSNGTHSYSSFLCSFERILLFII